ncbi:MAG TPA: hypothetical protein VFZ65_21460 [Planctomycetota bacterium]|nr:hypothetical protein [Planctomycetota bacterium]
MRSLVLVWLLALPAAVLAQEQVRPGTRSGRLRDVRISTSDVFSDEYATEHLLAAAVNALHWTTREQVIAREIWFERGSIVTAEDTAELERNLRALNLFADVSVRLAPTGNDGEVDLEVTTRDRLTLSFGGGGSYLGGVTGVRFALGESNLFGQGDALGASFFENSDGEYRGTLVYTDLHVLDTWHTGSVRYSRTDDGDSLGLSLRRPFKHLTDPRSYGFDANHDEVGVDYYRDGESVANVHDIGDGFDANLLWGDGPPDRRRTAGIVLALDAHDYDPATGPAAAEIRVPSDTQSAFLGPTARWRWIDGYRKVEGLDTIDYIQDLTLGLDVGATLGVRWRDEQGAGADLEPELRADVSWATEPLTGVFTNLGASGSMRLRDRDFVGWYGSLAGRAYAQVDSANTLAASVVFDAVEEKEGLPVELTLGEDNGLRGYPAHAFSGTRRLRTNLEDRLDTGLEFATLRLGLVAFFDTGWTGRDEFLGAPSSSVGFGLRIATKKLLGAGVVRIDFAKPLESFDGEGTGWKVSVSSGQVFGFGL